MKSKYNPYRKPFPRWYHLQRYSRSLVHPLQREAKEPYFIRKNPFGYHHDLGFMDLIFDNFGVLIEEQFKDAELRRQYLTELPKLTLLWWQAAKRQILQKRPFWGVNYNADSRDANAGEPRSLLRFVADEDLSRYSPTIIDHSDNSYDSEYAGQEWSFFENGRFINPYSRNQSAPSDYYEGFDYNDWDADDLFPRGIFPSYLKDEGVSTPEQFPFAGGVVLPEGFPKEVDALRILHPRHCTPDLPLRVGFDKKNFELYARLWRDQGPLGTCVSFAVSVALDLLVKRCAKRSANINFSPSWLHCMSGESGASGRSLKRVLDAIRRRLPCHEQEYLYDPFKMKEWRHAGPSWETAGMESSSRALTERFGRPDIRKLDVTDISAIKAHLAAGWLVIVSTSLTEQFWEHGILNNPSGLTFAPLKGQKRIPEGHAWLLTGYDHVDGNQRWKYQGRFIALNAWNIRRSLGKGIVTLPFAVLLTEGIEAYAIRLNS